jgi:raffinose/stachyose/melibiose transport system permease protein
LAGLLLPAQLGLLPLFQTIRDLGLLGTLLGVILVNIGGSMPFSVFLYAGFLRALPSSKKRRRLTAPARFVPSGR